MYYMNVLQSSSMFVTRRSWVIILALPLTHRVASVNSLWIRFTRYSAESMWNIQCNFFWSENANLLKPKLFRESYWFWLNLHWKDLSGPRWIFLCWEMGESYPSITINSMVGAPKKNRGDPSSGLFSKSGREETWNWVSNISCGLHNH